MVGLLLLKPRTWISMSLKDDNLFDEVYSSYIKDNNEEMKIYCTKDGIHKYTMRIPIKSWPSFRAKLLSWGIYVDDSIGIE